MHASRTVADGEDSFIWDDSLSRHHLLPGYIWKQNVVSCNSALVPVYISATIDRCRTHHAPSLTRTLAVRYFLSCIEMNST
jgi:hypothetical protein